MQRIKIRSLDPSEEEREWHDVRARYRDNEDCYTKDFCIFCREGEIEQTLIEEIEQDSVYPYDIVIIDFELL